MTALKNTINGFVSRLGIAGELLRFLWARKLWWLIPMMLALLVFVAFILLGASGPAGHFIYSLF